MPYHEKDQAKRLGAFWNADHKIWEAPDHINDLNPFKSWIPGHMDIIVRKPYLLCLSQTNCWKCGKETPMVALGARNYFIYQEHNWQKADQQILFSYVLMLSDEVANYMHRNYPFFKQVFSYTAEHNYFGNTCTNCGKLQGDFHHHCEPDGAFFGNPYSDPRPPLKFASINLAYDYHIEASYTLTIMSRVP